MGTEANKAASTAPVADPSQWTEATSPAKPHGTDTTFFMSRGGKQLMVAPMNELMAITERLVAQARALRRESMVPDLQKIADAARRLIVKFNETDTTETVRLDFSPLLTHLIESGQTPLPVPTASAPVSAGSRVLMIDDDSEAGTVVSLLLEQRGYRTTVALSGEAGLKLLHESAFDLILLDLLMPEMNGFQVLSHIRNEAKLRDVPIIILSGVSDMSMVVRAIEMGADDFLPKPFNPVLLRARVEASMEKKHLRDQEAAYLKQIQSEREKADRLLLNILPAPIASRLKQGEKRIADSYADVSVLFADLAGFTKLSSQIPATQLVELLNEVFTEFDQLAAHHGLEKIKTIGDAYMVVSGLPKPRPDHAAALADMALAMMAAIRVFNSRHGYNLNLRIGIHSGPVVAGIIGQNKFAYDLWGATVNVASRMESHGQSGCIQTTEATQRLIKDQYAFESRGRIEIRGLGEMETYFLTQKL